MDLNNNKDNKCHHITTYAIIFENKKPDFDVCCILGFTILNETNTLQSNFLIYKSMVII